MKKLELFIAVLLIAAATPSQAQIVAVKTNALYGAYTFTPNLSFEVGMGDRTTLDVGAGYNPWNRDGRGTDNKKLVHLLAQPELRYWFCHKFNGHFIGVHGIFSRYNIGGHKLPMLLGKDSDKFRYEGYAYGGGFSYGYQWILCTRWNLEVNIGFGYARLDHDRYECITCGEKFGREKRDYFGPTRAGVSLIFLIK